MLLPSVFSLLASVAFLTVPGIAPAAVDSSSSGEGPMPGAPESARLRALASALNAHDAAAIEAFWQEVQRTGTPLIEAVPGRSDDLLYTFLWRAAPDQVAVNVQFNGWFPLRSSRGFDDFTRLGESNVWYTSYTLPRNAQFRYELISPKGWHASPDRATYFTMDNREYETFHDPLNRDLIDWNGAVTSHAQGPAAVTSAYLHKRAGVPAGTIETISLPGDEVQHRPPLRIYLPAGYQATHRDYGLVLAYDGNQYTHGVPMPMILDNMIAAKAIPPVIVVFLESPDRDSEFPPNDVFQRYIGTVLMPQIHVRYRVGRDPARNVVLGSSYGGLAATYTAFKHPDLFANVISQSGSYAWYPRQPTPGGPAAATSPSRGVNPETGWLIKYAAELPKQNVRFYLDAGTWEGGGMLSANRLMRAVLQGKGYKISYHEEPGTHSSYYWMLRLPAELATVLGTK